MDPTLKTAENGPGSKGPERKGSVRRAREMLEAGRRPKIRDPQANPGVPPPRPNISRTNEWPLSSDNRLQTNAVDPQARLLVSNGLPPPQPPRHDLPSPSIYSERCNSEAMPSPLHINRPAPSFSQPLPDQSNTHPALREPVSAANDDMFRKSTASSVVSIPSIPDFPQLVPPQHTVANLAPPHAIRAAMNRRSSVSPIPEESLPDSPTIINKPYAPSRVTASSWCTEKAESDILGNCLDRDSEGAQEFSNAAEYGEGTLVRQASVGKRGRPSLRTISKPGAEPPQLAGNGGALAAPAGPMTGTNLKEAAAGNTRDSLASSSSESEESHIDPEKPPIVSAEDPRARYLADGNMVPYEKEAGPLPKGAPTMSETRPGARRPPRLDMNAVRQAEARGSLTSLSDLIKRATKLATNLEHGRTASRNDLFNGGEGSRFPHHGNPNRKSGSIKDILASFPNPAATPEGHSSWPMFWRRSTLHQLNSQEQGQGASREKGSNRRRRCCGMPLWAFIALCIVLILIVAAAVLIPIFLVVVPRQNQSNATCEKTTPCENGGVSVSSGDICSCVCVNGFTGSRCTIEGDNSCVTTEITQGSESRNATVGEDLPRLFQDAVDNFSIPLDPMTIMALFSQNNVSCTTENTLVSFKGLSSNDNDRRALSPGFLILDQLLSDTAETPASTLSEIPTETRPARRAVATVNGIVFDDSAPGPDEKLNLTGPTPTPTTTGAAATATTTTTARPTSTSSALTSEVLDFSRIAVLYILQRAGSLNAAMFSADSIQKYLKDSYSNSTSSNYVLDLVPSGVKGNFTLDFTEFSITDFAGETVGGD